MSYLPYILTRASLVPAICLLCLLVVTGQAQTNAHRHRVLIDRSGSMEGFFATGKVDDVLSTLKGLSGPTSDAYYFVDLDIVPVGSETSDFGNNTYLRNALDLTLAQQPAPAIVWLVTDNQPSVGNQTESDKDIREFYAQLRSEKVKRLYFFPLKLDFRGKLFREDGHQVLAPNYTGKRGLLIYALLLDEAATDEFERATSELQSRYEGSSSHTRRILIKPLHQDTIAARIIPGKNFRFDNQEHLVAGDFGEGSPISGKFDVELTSQMGHMKISSADVAVTLPQNFRTTDFTETEITPTFSPKYLKDFEPQTQRKIEVDLNAKGVHIRNNLVSWWNCITRNRGEVTGAIQVSIKVRGENLDVVSSLAKEFSTSRDIYNDPAESVQSRIYMLDDLIEKMMPEQSLDIRPQIGTSRDGTIPVRLTVRYPKWPLLALIVAVLLILLTLLLLRQLVLRPQLYRLTWDGGRYRACPDFRLWPFIGQAVSLDNRTVATIKKTLSGIQIHAAKGHTVDESSTRQMSPRGTDFNVNQSDTGTGASFFFSTATALGGSQTTRNADDIFGGVSYSTGGESGNSNVTASAPPIRKPSSGRRRVEGKGEADTKTARESSYDLDDLFLK